MPLLGMEDITGQRALERESPSFLEEIVLRDLQLNGASVDVKLRRHRSSVSVEVVEQRGEVQVSAVFG